MSSLFCVLWISSVHLTLKSNGQSYRDVDCVTVSSGDYVYGATQTVSCSDGYVMTGCGWESAWRQSGGSLINSDGECVAIPSPSSGRVRAVAQCCDIGAYASCSTVSNSLTGSIVTATCEEGDVVVGCVAQGESCADATDCNTDPVTDLEGAITNQRCTGHEQYNTESTVSVQSICCAELSETVEIECEQIVGDLSGTSDDAKSKIYSCANNLEGSGWFLTSCNEYSTVSNPQLDGHYTVDGDECWAHNSGQNSGRVRAVAQCCRIATPEPTGSPTLAPTNAPSLAPTTSPSATPTAAPSEAPTAAPSTSPTMDGCDFDLDTYLEECYCDGTQSGFNLGSAHSNGGYESSFDKYEFDQFRNRFDAFMNKYDPFMDKYEENYNYNNNMMMLFIFTNCLVLFSVVMICLCGNGGFGAVRNKHRYRKVDVISTSDDELQQLQ